MRRAEHAPRRTGEPELPVEAAQPWRRGAARSPRAEPRPVARWVSRPACSAHAPSRRRSGSRWRRRRFEMGLGSMVSMHARTPNDRNTDRRRLATMLRRICARYSSPVLPFVLGSGRVDAREREDPGRRRVDHELDPVVEIRRAVDGDAGQVRHGETDWMHDARRAHRIGERMIGLEEVRVAVESAAPS